MSASGIKTYVLLFVLAALTITVFYPALFCEFTNWDDPDLILKNTLIRSLEWENLQKMFGGFYWYNYQPLTLLSLAIEYHFFKLNPLVVHLDNILLHTLNAFLVFSFIRTLSGKNDSAFIAAALFAIHPMHVESVAWASERKDVLYAFFFLLALIQYVKYIKEPPRSDSEKKERFSLFQNRKRNFYLLSILFFILSCLSKGMAVSLSLVIIAIDYLMGRKWNRSFFLDKIPFFAISLFFGLVVSFAIVSDQINPLVEIHTFFEKIQYASYGFLYYLWKTIVPADLSVFTYYPYQTGKLPAYYLLFPVFAMLTSALFIFSGKWSKKIPFGLMFFLFTIIAVLQIKQTNAAMVADHYTYIPYIGLFFLAGEAFHLLRNSIHPVLSRLKEYVSGVAVVIILFLGYLSHERIHVWQNSVVLWEDAVSKHPSALAYFNLGHAWQEKKEYHKALENFNAALRIYPYYTRAYINRGNVKQLLGNTPESIRDFKLALLTGPKSVSAWLNLSAAKFLLKDTLGALSACNRAVKIDPNNAASYYNRGTIHAAQKNYASAYKDYSRSIELNPYEPRHYAKRGDLYAVLKKYQEAINDYTLCLQLDSTHERYGEDIGQIYYNRGMAAFILKDSIGACEDWNHAFKKGFTQSINKIYAHCKHLLQQNDIKKFLATSKQLNSVKKMKYDNGKVKLEIVDVFENAQVVKKLKHYDINGVLLEEGIVNQEGKYNGMINWYYPDGTIHISGYYTDTIPTGLWKEFYENGIQMAEYSHQNGKKEGIYKYFHTNGKLWTERLYKEDKLWTTLSNYNSRGVSIDPGTLKNGNGTVKVYNENGLLQQTLVYKNGQRVN